MSKNWAILSSTMLLILVLGGLSYLLPRFIGQDDRPIPQTLAVGELETEELVLEQGFNDRLTQTQTLAAAPTPLVTSTPSVSATPSQAEQPSFAAQLLPLTAVPYQTQALTGTWQITEVIKFEPPHHPDCSPVFAPQGERYLCYLVDENKEGQLWLGSLSQGLEKLLLDQSWLDYTWEADGQHIIYTPVSTQNLRPYRPQADPVYRLDIQTGETFLLGQTTWDRRTQALPTGQISFLNRYDIVLTSASQQARGQAATLIPIKEGSLSYRGRDDDSWLPKVEYFPGGSYDVEYAFSPDGNYVLVAELSSHRASITLIEVASQRRTFVAEVETRDRQLFSWASDSQKFAYTKAKPDQIGPFFPEIWVLDVRTKQAQLILQQRGGKFFNLTWLADQDDLLFAHDPHGTNPYVRYDYYVLNLNDGQAQRLISGGSIFIPFDQGQGLLFKTNTFDEANDRLIFTTWVAKLKKIQPE